MKPAFATDDDDRDIKPANDEQASDVLDVKEAAVLLRTSEYVIYNEVAGNRIPHRRIGKLIRFSRTALLRWLDAPTHKDP